jgi:putative ABC transport system ATP-binding protein
LIRISDIHFHYIPEEFHLGIKDLVIDAGEKVAFIGPSGSGKSTLLNLVAGILIPQEGVIEIDGLKITSQSDQARRDYRISNIGFVFQDFGLIDYLDVTDNILHPYRISGALNINGDVKDRVKHLAERTGVSSLLNRHPSELSHGERQRVAICRALLPKPKLILADEATGNLDSDNKSHILELLAASVEENNATLLAVTHEQELLHYFDRVINFRDFLQ